MWELVTHPSNLVFSISICLLFLFAFFELTLLLLGGGTQGILDQLLPADLTSPEVDIDTEAGWLLQVLDWLYLGRVPLLIWFIIFLTIFGLFGQQEARFEKGEPGGHHQIIGGELQPHLAGGFDEGEILLGQRQNGNAREINLLAAGKLQQEVERPLESVNVDEEGFLFAVRSVFQLERQLLRHHHPSRDSPRPKREIRPGEWLFWPAPASKAPALDRQSTGLTVPRRTAPRRNRRQVDEYPCILRVAAW